MMESSVAEISQKQPRGDVLIYVLACSAGRWSRPRKGIGINSLWESLQATMVSNDRLDREIPMKVNIDLHW